MNSTETNKRRPGLESKAARAKTALDVYERKHDQGADTQTLVADFLADTMHLLGEEKFDRAVDSARANYAAELAEGDSA